MEQELITLRRDFHRYPESGWTEFRTTARIIEELNREGIPVTYGRGIHAEGKRHGLPKPEVLERCLQRAESEGAPGELLSAMAGGYTGCVARIEGALPGPTTGIRVDIDCCDMEESADTEHLPVREGFRSVHEGCMHACGHDAHAAIGVGAAKLLWQARDRLRGTVILAFQPAEEGLRGAASMAEAGIFDTCDRFFGLHVGLMDAPAGTVAVSAEGFLASSKFDVTFHGLAAHAGQSPEKGRNALAAAAMATLDMLALPTRFSSRARLNVGTFHGGSGRNVIPAEAVLQVETRGDDTAENHGLEQAAYDACRAAAEQYGCTCDFALMGGAGTARCDESLAEEAARILRQVEGLGEVIPSVRLTVGEDVVTLMERVQQRGGRATELIFGMPLPYPHHSSRFDAEERLLALGARCLAALALESE